MSMATIKARLDPTQATQLACSLFGVDATSVTQMDGYDDKNFKLESASVTNPHIGKPWGPGYVLKVTNSYESKRIDLIEAQNQLQLFLGDNGFMVPQPVKTIQGQYYTCITQNDKDSNENIIHVVRLFTYQPGDLLKDSQISDDLYFNAGGYLARVDNTLKKFQHPAYATKDSIWMLENVPQIQDYISSLVDEPREALIAKIIDDFQKVVLTQIDVLEKGVIHGDYNAHNILVGDGEVIGLLDFGDTHYAPYVFDVAIGLAYFLLEAPSLEMGRHFIAGYEAIRKLTVFERSILKLCVCARLSQSLVLGAYSFSLEPDNSYLINSQMTKWTVLETLSQKDPEQIKNMWNI